ncbi:HAD-IA family hydrolase [Paenirhodobacter enshiensis]|uniref:phosphoglycolate phosphatase n=1 Tax=Paenirhodobacter enshiensis TaxID=1105367 RepID=A0A086XZS7_9RHOB|nr:HAD-IA family hydrolase [Paenirhodobacter enshiensis]KFI27527.1 haloacid dehalogenase [Paenirhodobacter enshiensis]
MRTVVFDLDGTLADTSADLIAAANACFRARGLGDRLDPVADALVAFQGGRAMLRLGYGRADVVGAEQLAEDDYTRLLDHYAADLASHTRLYPGAAEAVETLRGTGFRTAICTNKPEALARELVGHLGIAELFDALIGADTLPVRKPNPAPYRASVAQAGGEMARSFLVGDTQTDRETARNAGVASVLVTFGPEGGRIARLAPEALLDRYDALPALAERLLPR